jgi:hypothetical protein
MRQALGRDGDALDGPEDVYEPQVEKADAAFRETLERALERQPGSAAGRLSLRRPELPGAQRSAARPDPMKGRGADDRRVARASL